MNMRYLHDLARILGLRRAACAMRTPHPRHYAYGSAREARMAACRRMHPRRLWARLRRSTWSPTSMAAARQTLSNRALEG